MGYRLSVLRVTLQRSFKVWARYKVSMFFSIAGALSSALVFCYLGMVLLSDNEFFAVKRDISYAVTVLIGLVYLQFMRSCLLNPYSFFASGYFSGKLESLLLAPLPFHWFILADYLAIMVRSSIFAIAHVFLALAFGLHLRSEPDWLVAGASLIIGVISTIGLGLLSGSMFFLINAKGGHEPSQWLVTTMLGVLCGLYFPVHYLPPVLQVMGALLPHTYVFDIARASLLDSNPFALREWYLLPSINPSPLRNGFLSLVILSAIYLPLGLLAVRFGIRRAEKDGTLSRWT